MKRFLKGKAYILVRAPYWEAFVEACTAAGLKWGKRGRDTIRNTPAPLWSTGSIRALVINGNVHLSDPGAPKTFKFPTLFFVPQPIDSPAAQPDTMPFSMTRADFENGLCYAIVKTSGYMTFAKRMAELGFTWLLPDCPGSPLNHALPTTFMPFLTLDQAGEVAVHTAGTRRMQVFMPDEMPPTEQPVIPYEELVVEAPAAAPEPMPEPTKLVVVAENEGEVVARFMADKGSVSRTVAKCDPRDTFRFGPGAMLAAFRGMSDADKELALSLLIHEADTTHRKKSGRIVVRIECDTSKLQSSIAETARQVHAMYAQGALGRSIRGGIN